MLGEGRDQLRLHQCAEILFGRAERAKRGVGGSAGDREIRERVLDGWRIRLGTRQLAMHLSVARDRSTREDLLRVLCFGGTPKRADQATGERIGGGDDLERRWKGAGRLDDA